MEKYLNHKSFNLPSFDDGPAAREQGWGVNDEADPEPLRVVATEEPDQVLDHLVVHAAHAEVGQVKNNAQIVDHLLKTLFTSFLL